MHTGFLFLEIMKCSTTSAKVFRIKNKQNSPTFNSSLKVYKLKYHKFILFLSYMPFSKLVSQPNISHIKEINKRKIIRLMLSKPKAIWFSFFKLLFPHPLISKEFLFFFFCCCKIYPHVFSNKYSQFKQQHVHNCNFSQLLS